MAELEIVALYNTQHIKDTGESARLLFTSIQPALVLKDFQISWWLNNVGVWLLFHLLANYMYCLWALDGQNYQGAGQYMQSVWVDFVTELIVLGWMGLLFLGGFVTLG